MQHFINMCNDIKTTSPNSDGLFIVEDIANSGAEEEWKLATDILKQSNIENVYMAVGNHDLYGGSYINQINLFYKYANTDSLYYVKEIN